MKILNIGCGTKTSEHFSVTNIDWSMYLVIKTNPVLSFLGRFLLDAGRKQKLANLPKSILVHNLKNGIPFDNESVDVVYHSHFLEHLDPAVAPGFMQEVKRVLKPGGIQRIVVPDMEQLCSSYLKHLEVCRQNVQEIPKHNDYIAEIIEQMVRRDSYGTSRQNPIRRFVENKIMGDARKRGETHQWMYDQFNLSHLLREAGYQSVAVERYDNSKIPDWNCYGLDKDELGEEYKPYSLYVEAIK